MAIFSLASVVARSRSIVCIPACAAAPPGLACSLRPTCAIPCSAASRTSLSVSFSASPSIARASGLRPVDSASAASFRTSLRWSCMALRKSGIAAVLSRSDSSPRAATAAARTFQSSSVSACSAQPTLCSARTTGSPLHSFSSAPACTCRKSGLVVVSRGLPSACPKRAASCLSPQLPMPCAASSRSLMGRELLLKACLSTGCPEMSSAAHKSCAAATCCGPGCDSTCDSSVVARSSPRLLSRPATRCCCEDIMPSRGSSPCSSVSAALSPWRARRPSSSKVSSSGARSFASRSLTSCWASLSPVSESATAACSCSVGKCCAFCASCRYFFAAWSPNRSSASPPEACSAGSVGSSSRVSSAGRLARLPSSPSARAAATCTAGSGSCSRCSSNVRCLASRLSASDLTACLRTAGSPSARPSCSTFSASDRSATMSGATTCCGPERRL